MQAQINLRTLAATAICASGEQFRYYLNGVCVEVQPRAVIYTATNGHILFTAREETDEENTLLGTWIIPTEACKAIKLAKRGNPNATMTTDASGKLYLDYMNDVRGFTPVDGTFPDWRRAIPGGFGNREQASPDEIATMGYNPQYVALFDKIQKTMDLGCKTQLVPNGNGPAFVWFGENEDCFGVIMPMRQMDMRSRVRPEWVDAKPEAAAPHLKVVSG